MTARDIMHRDVECIPADETLDRAAQLMRNLDVGALPICNTERNQLIGMVTDRDIVIRCIAEGHDPSRVRAGDLAQGMLHTVAADADVRDVLATMEQHRIKRLPVIDDEARMIGMICESDLARNIDDERIATFVSTLSAIAVPH
jgi:CBS domain-containing protein